MFAAFCAKSTMHGVIQRLSSLDGWKDSVAVTERSLSVEDNGTYASEARTESETKATQTNPPKN